MLDRRPDTRRTRARKSCVGKYTISIQKVLLTQLKELCAAAGQVQYTNIQDTKAFNARGCRLRIELDHG
jgi:hypothetical protein